MPLHTKYRPRKLADVVGNKAAVAALGAALGREDRPHAYLFAGPSGCGKTTLARIAARELGCSKWDFQELNTADFRGIDTVRDALRQMQLAPMHGPCRVWLLDEAHQLSKDAQSALLKALEDTPAHVYLMLATTDPDKLLPTIRNRCATFTVAPLSDEEMEILLARVLEREADGKMPIEAINKILDMAQGSARLALVLLETALGLGPDEALKAVEAQAARENAAIDLCRLLLKRAGWGHVAAVLKGIEKEEPETIRRMVLGYCSSVLMRSKGSDPTAQRAFHIIECFHVNFYDMGRAGLITACWEAVNTGE